ncbi:hypothetical protein GCM10010329_46890 [Streptomyces spiroverticillatus]|uniref:HTH araC/xylS-type domain-containing protein n=1 Tax=Streptomyces finlayi TaxID=67296 RepID=A0A918X053_9ACTN|nr:helix-turn-helix domain-containing protein [Streptomyces finlayi]GHA18358.1 hypothetical protein GCM10010329_46890 [Streptomyces spiroverticillatus]GHC99963.1 hypothetical protein GCM10010334_44060 [Streptomyces finlayi]
MSGTSAVLSTLPLPPADRAAYWHALVSGTFVPLDVTLHAPTPPAGTITSRRLGPLQVSEVEAGPQTVSRSPRRIAQGGAEFLTVTLQQRGTARLTQDGRQALVRPGGFTCSDAGRPYEREQPEDFRFTTFRIPKECLGVREGELRAVTGTLFHGGSGTAALIAAFLGRLAGQAADLDPATGHQLGLTAADLLAILVRERRGELVPQAPEAARGMLARVKEYVLHHLDDPSLTPARIAAAHHVSVRYLHLLFRAEGTSVGRWMLAERLARCRRELSRPPGNARAVSAVAQRWGFVNPSHFSRSFRAAYGMSPREWQAEARLPEGRARSAHG